MTTDERKRQKVLRNLVSQIEEFLERLDKEMAGPSSYQRGRRIGQLATALEMAKDQARFDPHGLNIDFRRGEKRKEAARV